MCWFSVYWLFRLLVAIVSVTAFAAMSQYTIPPPVFLVTGFLGSGKTQFLQTLLENPITGTDNAVIVNDFGDVVYDRFLLGKNATTLLELPGGCLCCSALDDFRQALSDVATRSPERIFVETTGLANAASVRADLGFMGFPVEATFCVVDALHWQHSQQQYPLFDSQLREADYVLISKGDIASANQLDALQLMLPTLNSRAPVVVMRQGRVDADMLLAALAPTRTFAPFGTRAQPHLISNTVTAFRIRIPRPAAIADIESCLQRLPAGVARVKGTLLTDNGNDICENLLNFVNGRWSITPVPEANTSAGRSSSLFLIGFALAPPMIHEAFAGLHSVVIEEGEVTHKMPNTQ